MKRHSRVRLIVIFLIANIFSLGRSTEVLAQNDNFQPGYIVTAKNDTLKGFVMIDDHAFNTGNCVFKESVNGAQKKYTPEEVNVCGVVGKSYYYSSPVDVGGQTQKVFLECLVKGKVSLFFFQERYFMTTETKTVELLSSKSKVTKGDQVFTVDLPVYKGILQVEMNDCGTIHENLKGTNLTSKALTRLFMDYHQCKGLTAVAFEAPSSKGGVRLGFSLGMLASGLSIKSEDHPSFYYLDNNDPMTDISFTPSFWIEFSSKSKLRFRTGLTYYSSKYHSYDEDKATNLDHELTIKHSRIEMPLQLKYCPFNSNEGLYIVGGIGLNATIKWEDNEITKVRSSGYVLSEGPAFYNSSLMTNLLAGLGYEFNVKNRKLFAEVNYAHSQSVLTSQKTPVGTVNAITFNVGLLF
jgi:Outer membrane protein beta-barrel domain